MTLDDPERIRIEAVDVRPPPHRRPPSRNLVPIMWTGAAILVGVVLLAAAGFVFTARRVTIQVEPPPDHVTLRGGWIQPRIGDAYLLLPGAYTVRAGKEGFRDAEQALDISSTGPAVFTVRLEPLDGFLSIDVVGGTEGRPALAGATVNLDGELPLRAPVREFRLAAGPHELTVSAPRYQPHRSKVEIDGMNRHQSIQIELLPAWGTVFVDAVPAGADVLVGQERRGAVPIEMELEPGPVPLTIQAEGYQSFATQLVIRANESIRLDVVRLEEALARLNIRTQPAGALVSVDGAYAGATPLEVPLRPRDRHDVRISKAGYQELGREVSAQPGEQVEWTEELTPITGLVRFDVDPEGAELILDGKPWGKPPDQVELTAVEHRLELRKDGFAPHQAQIRPKPGYPLLVKVRLEPLSNAAPAVDSAAPAEIRTSSGYVLRRIDPGPFQMGASRREQGRRSNETLVSVDLRRPFFIGVKEVTNLEFRAFRPDHNSGLVRRESLNRDEQPVVNVSWADAARFCNWLSAQEGLPEVYQMKGEAVSPRDPVPVGYRLPTETEWAFAARVSEDGTLLRYPWGEGFPPATKAGNFADSAAVALLARVLSNYTDGSVVTTRPGSFAPGPRGLFDLGGNAAEWCHDYYSVYSYDPQQTVLDPVGPSEGAHHVIRGSSWKDATITALRLSFRDYGDEARDDVGFRLARYADDGGGS